MKSAIKIHGGKRYLAKQIVALMPPRCKNPNKPAQDDTGWSHYCEPLFGSGAVLFENDPTGISEVVNDLNQELAHFWYVLADTRLFPDFLRRVQATPVSEALWDKCSTDPVNCLARMPTDSAADFFVRCRQSMAGRMKGFTPLTKLRTRRGMNAEASAWLSAVEGLPEVHERLKRVVIFCKDATEVIRQQDGPRTLFYIDAPYVHSERATVGEYRHEMTDDQHAALIDTLLSISGRAIVSMYRHPIYDTLSKNGWSRVDFDLPNNAAGGDTKRRMTECCWMNYEPATSETGALSNN